MSGSDGAGSLLRRWSCCVAGTLVDGGVGGGDPEARGAVV